MDIGAGVPVLWDLRLSGVTYGDAMTQDHSLQSYNQGGEVVLSVGQPTHAFWNPFIHWRTPHLLS